MSYILVKYTKKETFQSYVYTFFIFRVFFVFFFSKNFYNHPS